LKDEPRSDRLLRWTLHWSDVRSRFGTCAPDEQLASFRDNPLFPFIPFGPIALFLGSVVMSALALRGVRQVRRELAAIAA